MEDDDNEAAKQLLLGRRQLSQSVCLASLKIDNLVFARKKGNSSMRAHARTNYVRNNKLPKSRFHLVITQHTRMQYLRTSKCIRVCTLASNLIKVKLAPKTLYLSTCFFFNPADPRGITQGGLLGFRTQLDIFRSWYQGLIKPQVSCTRSQLHCPIANSASTQSLQPVVQDG